MALMYDINRFPATPRLSERDPHGLLDDIAHWSPRVAGQIALKEGIELEKNHWQVICCLREYFRELGPEGTAREVTRRLEKDLADAGGRLRTLADLRGRWLVLYFYSKGDTPGCTAEARGFRDDQARFAVLGAQVVGVSLDAAVSPRLSSTTD